MNFIFFFVEAVPIHLDRVVNHLDLRIVDPVMVVDDVLGQQADGDDLHRPVHAAPLDVINARIDVHTAAIKLRRMHVHDQRHPLDPRHRQASRKCHPVVSMHDVKLFLPCNLARQ